MMRKPPRKIHAFFGTIFLLAVALCVTASPAMATPAVLATIKPIHSLVAGVMAGVGTPDLLIGGAASVHSYSFKPSDARKIAGASVIFEVSPDLETYLNAPLRNLSHAKVVALASVPGVLRLPAREGGLWQKDADHSAPFDPHLWLDPQNAIAMTRAIAATLSAADPAHAHLYSQNATRQITTLTALDGELRAKVAPVRARHYLVFHDAYQYFEHRYGLSAAGSVTVSPDRPVGPQRLVALRQSIAAGKATCLFREPQFPPRLIDTLTEGHGIRVGVLDPLGADIASGPGLYPILMRQLAQSLSTCLKP